MLLLILSNHFIQPIITRLLLFQIIEKLKDSLEMSVTVWIFFPLPLELTWAQTWKLSLPFGGAISKFGPAKQSLMMDASAPPSLRITAAVMGEWWVGFRKCSHLHPLIQGCRLACSQQILSVTMDYRETSLVLITSPAIFLLSHWRS